MRTFQLTAAAFALVAILTPITNALETDSASTWWTFGARINQGKPFGLIGVTKQLGPRIFQYTGADLGGVERSLTTQTAIRITRPAKFTLYGLAGPQIETIETNPTLEQTTDYLTASTGAILSYEKNPQLSAFIAFQYLWTNISMKRWKFGLGILVPIDLS